MALGFPCLHLRTREVDRTCTPWVWLGTALAWNLRVHRCRSRPEAVACFCRRRTLGQLQVQRSPVEWSAVELSPVERAPVEQWSICSAMITQHWHGTFHDAIAALAWHFPKRCSERLSNKYFFERISLASLWRDPLFHSQSVNRPLFNRTSLNTRSFHGQPLHRQPFTKETMINLGSGRIECKLAGQTSRREKECVPG